MMGIGADANGNPNGTMRPLLPSNAQTQAAVNSSFGGLHPQICMFVFCDGSVRAIQISTPKSPTGRRPTATAGM